MKHLTIDGQSATFMPATWFKGGGVFPYTYQPFFMRGGSYSTISYFFKDSNFTYGCDDGGAYSATTFRLTLSF